MCGGHLIGQAALERSHVENTCKWRYLRHKPPSSSSGRRSNPLLTMNIKNHTAAVVVQSGNDARKNFIVSTTIPPQGRRQHLIAYGCAGFTQELLEQHAAAELKVEEPFTLGNAIGLLQRFTARTGIQLFFRPEIRKDGTDLFVQYRIIDIRFVGVTVRFVSGPGGAPNVHSTSLGWQLKPYHYPIPRLLIDKSDVQSFIKDTLESGVLRDGPHSGLRPPANYLEYIEAEQEHLSAQARQRFTIFGAPPGPDGKYPRADSCGVEGGWKECFEQYPARKRPASTTRPGCSTGWDSPLTTRETREWSAGRLRQSLVTLRDATLTEMLQQLTKDLIRYFPDRPLVGMDSEGKNPIVKVQLAIYNSVYILDVSTDRGQQDLDRFLRAICCAKGIIALDRDLREDAPPEGQDAFLLRNVRDQLEVVDLYVELTQNGWMPENTYAYRPVSGSRPEEQPQLRKVGKKPVWSASLIMMLDAVAPTKYFYVKPKGIYWVDAKQEQSGHSRWEQRCVPDELLVYAATDAIITRNILKAVRSNNAQHTCQQQDGDSVALWRRLSQVTGIPVPSTWRPSA